ncbi:MAG: glyoxalase [Microthrixaceae bacterium]
MDSNSDETPTLIWPTLNYDDALAAIEFLTSIGFTSSIVVPNEEDSSVIEHCQLHWPEGGGVMLSSAGREGNEFSQRPTGCGAAYVVTADPDGAFNRAVAAGATPFRAMEEQDYGGRGGTVSDAEGNLWSFGDYRGE